MEKEWSWLLELLLVRTLPNHSYLPSRTSQVPSCQPPLPPDTPSMQSLCRDLEGTIQSTCRPKRACAVEPGRNRGSLEATGLPNGLVGRVVIVGVRCYSIFFQFITPITLVISAMSFALPSPTTASLRSLDAMIAHPWIPAG